MSELAHASLDVFDTIVVGPNAFLVRDALRKAARRLLEYAHKGGTLVVQYQGYAHEGMGAAPFPFRYNQPHDRVTIEQSPVRIVQPDHFFFDFPNRIGEDDFAGWVRDRGMYFFGEWDPAYEPLLACGDPGEGEKLGGLLVAGYGRGLYAYCGYTLFRQLPHGVRGAFRLFSNLLALPEARIRSRMERLRDVSLFAELDEADLHQVAKIATERRLAEGEYLFHEGDEGTELYVIETGALDVMRGEQPVGTVAARWADRRARDLHGSPAAGLAESVRRDAALRHPLRRFHGAPSSGAGSRRAHDAVARQTPLRGAGCGAPAGRGQPARQGLRVAGVSPGRSRCRGRRRPVREQRTEDDPADLVLVEAYGVEATRHTKARTQAPSRR